MLEFKHHLENSTLTIECVGAIKNETQIQFKTALKSVNYSGVSQINFNFKDLTFIDSAGLGVLLSFCNKYIHNNPEGKLQVLEINEHLLVLFKSLRLDRLFKI